MRVIVLPGFSKGNQEFLYTVQQGLKNDFPATTVIPWRHWMAGEDQEFIVDREAEKIAATIDAPTYIIAKSIGTLATMFILKSKSDLVKKIILNGIPLSGLDEGTEKLYKDQLSQYDASKLIVFQNESDPWGSFIQVSEFMHDINLDIQVVSMPRSDHTYPYVEEFKQFLL